MGSVLIADWFRAFRKSVTTCITEEKNNMSAAEGDDPWYMRISLGKTKVIVLKELGDNLCYMPMVVTGLEEGTIPQITQLTEVKSPFAVHNDTIHLPCTKEPIEVFPYNGPGSLAVANEELANFLRSYDPDAAVVEAEAGFSDEEMEGAEAGEVEPAEREDHFDSNGDGEEDVVQDIVLEDGASLNGGIGAAMPLSPDAAVIPTAAVNTGTAVGLADEGPDVAEVASKIERIFGITKNYSSALGVFAHYLDDKAQGILADHTSLDESKTFHDPESVPGPSLIHSMWDHDGVETMKLIIHMSPFLNWSENEGSGCLSGCVHCSEEFRVKPLSKEEYDLSGLSAYGILENPACRREILACVDRGYHWDVRRVTKLDSAWSSGGALMKYSLRSSSRPFYVKINLTEARLGEQPSFSEDEKIASILRGYASIGPECDAAYDKFLAFALHSLDTERQLALLSKEYSKIFGHTFNVDHFLFVTDFAKREKLLELVPAPSRRAIRSVIAEKMAKRRKLRGDYKGTKPDEAGYLDRIEENLKKIQLKSTEKDRRKEIYDALKARGIREWPGMKAKGTGWINYGLPSKYIVSGGEEEDLDRVIADALEKSASVSSQGITNTE